MVLRPGLEHEFTSKNVLEVCLGRLEPSRDNIDFAIKMKVLKFGYQYIIAIQ